MFLDEPHREGRFNVLREDEHTDVGVLVPLEQGVLGIRVEGRGGFVQHEQHHRYATPTGPERSPSEATESAQATQAR